MQRVSSDSGIQAVGEVPFGTHFCQFYRTRQDLIDTLLPGPAADRQHVQGMLVVAVTGYGKEEDRHRGQAAGFHHHLVKPVDPGALQALIAGVSKTGDRAEPAH